MDKDFLMTGMFVVLVLVFLFGMMVGSAVVEDDIVRNCERFSAFYIEDQRFTCNPARNLP